VWPEADVARREAAIRLGAEAENRERRDVLDAERRGAGAHADVDRLVALLQLEADGVTNEVKVLRELPHPCAHRLRRQHEVVEQRRRAWRRHAGELEPEVRRESFTLRALDDRAKRFAWNPRVWIVEVAPANSGRRQQRVDGISQPVERVHERPHVVGRHAPHVRSAGDGRRGARGQ
jgi:hypothetical protein